MSSSYSESVYLYAVAVASVARVFTLAQIGNHPYLRDLSQPQKRAWESLSSRRSHFDCSPGRRGTPYKWRLSKAGKRANGVKFRDVDPQSAKAEHWIEIGNVFLALQRYGGRPMMFEAEPKDCAGFDIATIWRKQAYFFEVQRSPLSQRDWNAKWKRIQDWYVAKRNEQLSWWVNGMQPRIVVINRTGREIVAPRGVGVYASAEVMAVEMCKPPL